MFKNSLKSIAFLLAWLKPHCSCCTVKINTLLFVKFTKNNKL